MSASGCKYALCDLNNIVASIILSPLIVMASGQKLSEATDLVSLVVMKALVTSSDTVAVL